MTAALWLLLGSLLYSLQLSTGSFPKPLTAQEERLYLERASHGDLEARNVLIERNLRLVAHVIKKYYVNQSDQEDLVSIGTIGLIKAISTFDASKGTRLATYAARCVENATLTPRTLRAERLHPKAKTDILAHFGLSFRSLVCVFLFPASLFYGFNDRVQKFQLLACGAVQILDLTDDRCCMDIRHSLCQRFFACFCFGMMYDHIDRRHASDCGHLLKICYDENMLVNFSPLPEAPV